MKLRARWTAIVAGGVLAASCTAGPAPQRPAAASQVPLATAAAEVAPTASGATRPRLTIAMAAVGIQTMAVTTAARGGFFEKHGLEVTVEEMADGRQVMMAMLQGRADLAVVPPGMLVQSLNSPRPLVAVGAVTGTTSLNVVVAERVARERGLTVATPAQERLKALKGLRIGYPGGGPLGINTGKAVAEAAGLDPERDVRLIPIGGPGEEKEQVSALARGEIDGFIGHHPYLEEAIVGHGAMLLLHMTAGEVPAAGAFPHHVLAAHARSSVGKDALRAVVAALAEAQRAIHGDPNVAVKALRAAFPELSAPLLEQGMRIYLASVPATPAISREGFNTALRLFGAGPVPFQQAVDNSFAGSP